MVAEPKRISFDEFMKDPQAVFEDARDHDQVVLVARGSELFRIEWATEPQDIFAAYDPEEAVQAVRASAGTLRGVDTDALLADLAEEREQETPGRR